VVIPQIDTEIKLSLWLVEVWLPDARQWRVDKIERLEAYAAAYVDAMKAALSEGQRLRMRRFVEEGKTPRGGKVRKVRD
jgi:hypothetical protein